MSKVTVLMPVYNGEKYLKESIESILAQTFCDFEFLIIDDGSSDESGAIISSYGKDKRLRFVENEKNIGQMATLNLGIKLSRGQYIARMDQDDTSLPARLARESRILDMFDDIALVYSDSYIIDEYGLRRDRTFFEYVTPRRLNVFNDLIRENFIIGNTVMMRKNVFDAIGFYNPSYRISAEYDLYLRLARRYKVDFVDEGLAEYRAHGTNTSSSSDKTTMEVIELLKRFDRSEMDEKQKRLMDKMIARYTANLSIFSLFEDDRHLCRDKAREALQMDPLNSKAIAALFMASFFPRSLVRSMGRFRRGWLE